MLSKSKKSKHRYSKDSDTSVINYFSKSLSSFKNLKVKEISIDDKTIYKKLPIKKNIPKFMQIDIDKLYAKTGMPKFPESKAKE